MSLLTKNRKRVELVWPRNPMAIYLAIAFIILLAASIAYLRHSDLKGNKVSTPSQEIVTKRTATTKTFLNNDGTLTSRFYGQPVNYKDSNGKWQRIDTNFVKKGNRYIVNKASYNLVIPKKVSEWASFGVGKNSVSFVPVILSAMPAGRQEAKNLRDPSATPQDDTIVVKHNRVTYKNVYKIPTSKESLLQPG